MCVVGAGAAGLAAASTLLTTTTTRGEQRRRVLVLEARPRAGGRVHTDHHSFTVPVERGAQWIHGVIDNPIAHIVTAMNVPYYITDYDNTEIYDVDTVMEEHTTSALSADYERVIEEVAHMQESTEADSSLAAAITDIYTRLGYTATQQRLTNFAIVDEIELEYGTSSEKLSMWWWDTDEELDGEDWWMPEGYDSVIDRLTEGCDIRYNQSVVSIDYSDESMAVITTASQNIFNCTKVIVTVPLGILKNGNISFIPPLPSATQHSIDHLEMGLLEKHFVHFTDSFWSNLTDFFYILDQDDSRYNLSEYVEIFNLDHYIDDAHLLCLFSSGDAAFDREKLSENERLQHLMSRLRQVWPAAPDPDNYVFTSWGNDPYTYGAYSSVGLGGSTDDRKAFRNPVENMLYFAGEHTSVCFPSTVHGAYLSGVNAAEVLMGGIQDDLCSWGSGIAWYESVAFIVIVCTFGCISLAGLLLWSCVIRRPGKPMVFSKNYAI